MKYILILLVALSFMGCKGDFIVKETKQSFTRQETETCRSKCGICSYTKNGKNKTGFSCKCKGVKDITVEITPQIGYYEKEPNSTVTRDKRRIIRKSSTCR